MTRLIKDAKMPPTWVYVVAFTWFTVLGLIILLIIGKLVGAF